MSDLRSVTSGEIQSRQSETRASEAARLTQQLLAFSRKAMFEPKLIDLNELVT